MTSLPKQYTCGDEKLKQKISYLPTSYLVSISYLLLLLCTQTKGTRHQSKADNTLMKL